MIKVMNVIQIKKGRVDEVLPLFSVPKKVHTFEGFVLMEVLRNENNEEYDELNICTTWQEKKHFDAWVNSQSHAKREHKEDNPIMSNKVSMYDVVYSHEPADE